MQQGLATLSSANSRHEHGNFKHLLAAHPGDENSFPKYQQIS